MKTKLDPLSLLLLIFGLLLGAYARVLPAMLVGFPVTDGGLFYLMTQALQARHFALPLFIEYNGAALPFAYPPLGFYFTALLASVFDLPLLTALRWLPALWSVAFTIAFYFLASAVLKSPFKGMLAAVFFALLPRSVGWFVMGGGITRAPGQLFLLLTVYAAYQLFTTQAKKYTWLTALFASGAVLSHPESALHTAALCGVLWSFHGRSKVGTKNALLVALGVVLLCAPFFVTVIARHGLAPYRHAAATGLYDPLAWLGIFTGAFADEKFITLISACATLGLIVTLSRRGFLLPVWLILPALIDPRGGASVAISAWALLAAIGFADVIVPGLLALQGRQASTARLQDPLVRAVLTVMIFYAFFGMVAADQVYPKVSLTQAERDALQWVNANIPPRSRFAIVTGSELAFADALSEWFPALTESFSVATVQGQEWTAEKPFAARLTEYNALQACMARDSACLEAWQGGRFDYVLVSKDSPLAAALAESANYATLYQQGSVFIFKPKP